MIYALIMSLWVVYGLLAWTKTNKKKFRKENRDVLLFVYIIFAPLILVLRMIDGSFIRKY